MKVRAQVIFESTDSIMIKGKLYTFSHRQGNIAILQHKIGNNVYHRVRMSFRQFEEKIREYEAK